MELLIDARSAAFLLLLTLHTGFALHTDSALCIPTYSALVFSYSIGMEGSTGQSRLPKLQECSRLLEGCRVSTVTYLYPMHSLDLIGEEGVDQSMLFYRRQPLERRVSDCDRVEGSTPAYPVAVVCHPSAQYLVSQGGRRRSETERGRES